MKFAQDVIDAAAQKLIEFLPDGNTIDHPMIQAWAIAILDAAEAKRQAVATPFTRAKFVVSHTTNHRGGTEQVHMDAVSGYSPEDKLFWKYTPSGQLDMSFSNECPARGIFKPDDQFYLDFTPVSKGT